MIGEEPTNTYIGVQWWVLQVLDIFCRQVSQVGIAGPSPNFLEHKRYKIVLDSIEKATTDIHA